MNMIKEVFEVSTEYFAIAMFIACVTGLTMVIIGVGQ